MHASRQQRRATRLSGRNASCTLFHSFYVPFYILIRFYTSFICGSIRRTRAKSAFCFRTADERNASNEIHDYVSAPLAKCFLRVLSGPTSASGGAAAAAAAVYLANKNSESESGDDESESVKIVLDPVSGVRERGARLHYGSWRVSRDTAYDQCLPPLPPPRGPLFLLDYYRETAPCVRGVAGGLAFPRRRAALFSLLTVARQVDKH